MSNIVTDEQAVGVELDHRKLKVAWIEQQKGQPKIRQCIELDLPDAETSLKVLGKDGQITQELLKNYLVVSAAPTSDVLIRRLRLKLIKDKDVDEAFPFQAESLLPFSLEDGMIDKIKVEKQDDGTLLTFAAIRKDFLEKHLNELAKWKIDPEVTSAVPFALATFAQFAWKIEDPVVVLHLGFGSSTCSLVKQGKLLAGRGCEVGLNSLLEAYSKDQQIHPDLVDTPFEQLHFSELDAAQTPNLYEALPKWKQEIGWLLLSQVKDVKTKDGMHLLLTGDGAVLKELVKALDFPPEYTQIESVDDQLKLFAVPIGLALSALPGFSDQINFRQKMLAYAHPWKRFKKPLIVFASLCFALAAAFYWFSESYIQYQEDELKKRYTQMLATLHQPYQEVETQVTGDESVKPVLSLSLQDLVQRLNFLEKQAKGQPNTFPLYPNVPRVSDLLAWLSTHPKVVCKEESGACPSIELTSLHYTMVKYPEQSKQNEKYQVKVDLEFSTPSPTIAREFHDALIAPNDLVDPKGDVKWTANRGSYRASFYLKDKTYYPPAIKG